MLVPEKWGIPDPFVGTVVCVRTRANREVWRPALLTKAGAPFAWKLEVGIWAPAKDEDTSSDIDEDGRLFEVVYFGNPHSADWPSMVHLQSDEVKPFGYSLAELSSRVLLGNLLRAYIAAQAHIRIQGTKMEKSLIAMDWVIELLLPSVYNFPTKYIVGREAAN